jgi:hypothetical protein
MKRTLKVTLLASAAVFVLGAVTPSLAQQANMRANTATSQNMPQQTAAESIYEAQASGDDAYAYVPLDSATHDGCTTQGSYGQGLDHSACGG